MANSKLSFRFFQSFFMAFVMVGLASPHIGWAANNCLTQQSGVGGTGAATHGGGIGGTGSLAAGEGTESNQDIGRNSGIGGTGIVGIITGFASICVNDIEIHYDPETPLQINGRPATAKELAVGQLVMAEATGSGNELAARNISVQYAVSGEIANVSEATGQVQVMGQEVQITEHTINPDGTRVANFHAGDYVQVSGLRKQDGVIVAARIDRAPVQNEVSVSGPVSRVSDHEFSVYGLRVAPASGNVPDGIAAGREVRVSGQMKGGILKAEKIEIAPVVPFDGRSQRLELQGYLHVSRTPGELSVGQVQLEISPQYEIGEKLATDQLVRVSARLTPEKRLVVEHIEVARDYFQRGDLQTMNRDGTGQGAKKAERKEHNEMRSNKHPSEASEHSERDRNASPESGSHSEKRERDARSESDRRVELPEQTERFERGEFPEGIEPPEQMEHIEHVEPPELHSPE